MSVRSRPSPELRGPVRGGVLARRRREDAIGLLRID
jgi:hypothetical protein